MDAQEVITIFVEKLWNQRQLALADDLFPPDFVAEPIAHQPMWQGTGPDSMKHHIQEWVDGVPDLQMKFIASTTQGTQIWVRWEILGTHSGVLYGVPPTGRNIRALGVTLFEIDQGKIRKLQTIFDALGLMQQLDVLPDAGTLIQNHLSRFSS
jgi:predicted ester cyclase